MDAYARGSRLASPPYHKIAEHLRLGGLVDGNGKLLQTQDAQANICDAVKNWLAREKSRDWLLVFDNIDDLDSFHITEFFPPAQHGCIILTSRRTESALLGEELKLDVMEEEESINLLLKSASKASHSTDEGREART